MEQNFKSILIHSNNLRRIQLYDNTYNFIDKECNLLSKQNFKYVEDFQEGFAVVKLSNDTWYYIDKDLNFYDYKTQTPVPNPFNEKVLNNINELVNLNYSTINNIYLIQNPTPEDISSYQKSIIRFKQLYPNSNCNIKLDLINNTLELINFDTIDIFHFAYQLAIIQNIK